MCVCVCGGVLIGLAVKMASVADTALNHHSLTHRLALCQLRSKVIQSYK